MGTDTSMEIRRAVALSLRTSFLLKYSDAIPAIDRQLELGSSIYESFLEPQNVFPQDLLDAIHVGEQSGNLSESLSRVSEKYQHEAETALQAFSAIGFFLILSIVAIFMVAMIIHIFKVSYLDQINEYLPKESKLY